MAVVFGRFRGGEPIAVPRGTLLYVGSALAEKGSASLARRLLRHATRSAGKPPHTLRAGMLAAFSAAGLGAGNLIPPQGKKLRWHIDFLLDDPAVEIDRVLVIRSPRRLESAVAHLLAADPRAVPLAAGLGASDAPGETHLFRVPEDDAWWATLREQVQERVWSMEQGVWGRERVEIGKIRRGGSRAAPTPTSVFRLAGNQIFIAVGERR